MGGRVAEWRCGWEGGVGGPNYGRWGPMRWGRGGVTGGIAVAKTPTHRLPTHQAGMNEYAHSLGLRSGFYENNCICAEEGVFTDPAEIYLHYKVCARRRVSVCDGGECGAVVCRGGGGGGRPAPDEHARRLAPPPHPQSVTCHLVARPMEAHSHRYVPSLDTNPTGRRAGLGYVWFRFGQAR